MLMLRTLLIQLRELHVEPDNVIYGVLHDIIYTCSIRYLSYNSLYLLDLL